MSFRRIISILAIALLTATAASASKRYLGGDISLLPEYQNANAKYYTHSGSQVSDPLQLFADEGMNSMRVRLFVDPSAYQGNSTNPADANACQDLAYIKPLCKQIKDAGFKLVLDFHYSDYWADPVKQYTPAAWASMTDAQLYTQIYTYTKEVLTELVAYGATPDFIQTGNEISYGMLWGPEGTSTANQKKCQSGSSANWSRFTTLLTKAIQACREVCPSAKIILHTERTARNKQSIMLNFYNQMASANIDYDIIGLSYYPYYHGTVADLEAAITALENNYPAKDIQIVEFGYPYKWEMSGDYADYTTYPASDAGQLAITTDLITMLNKHTSVTGLYWWWMEYNAYGTSLSGWYNAALFDSTTGRATSALSYLKNFIPENNDDDPIDEPTTYPATLALRSTADGNPLLGTLTPVEGQTGVYSGTLTGAEAWQNFYIVDEESGTWYGCQPDNSLANTLYAGDDKWNLWIDSSVAGDYTITANLVAMTWSFTYIDPAVTPDPQPTTYPATLSIRSVDGENTLIATLRPDPSQAGFYAGIMPVTTAWQNFNIVDDESGTWYGCQPDNSTANTLYTGTDKWNLWINSNQIGTYLITADLVALVWTHTQALRGDIDGSGTLDGSDVSAMLEIVLSGGDLSALQLAAADIDGNGVIDGSDVSAMLEIVLSGN